MSEAEIAAVLIAMKGPLAPHMDTSGDELLGLFHFLRE